MVELYQIVHVENTTVNSCILMREGNGMMFPRSPKRSSVRCEEYSTTWKGSTRFMSKFRSISVCRSVSRQHRTRAPSFPYLGGRGRRRGRSESGTPRRGASSALGTPVPGRRSCNKGAAVLPMRTSVHFTFPRKQQNVWATPFALQNLCDNQNGQTSREHP